METNLLITSREKWIRIFDVPSASRHKGGFTIYKIISMLYPESCPDAVTKITVWKRFNDFKKLYREIKILHRKYKLSEKLPILPRTTLFKRFDEETINQRTQAILTFLEFIGNNQQLFTSSIFVKFFETSYTPAEHLSSNISAIRSELNLPEDPEVLTNCSSHSDDEGTSDIDTISSTSVQGCGSNSSLNQRIIYSDLRKPNSVTSIDSQSSRTSETLSIPTISDSITLFSAHIYPTPPNTPAIKVPADTQCAVDASIHINLATELEGEKKYDLAYTAYKTAVDILLKYEKDFPNTETRYAIEKYQIKAEKLFNMHLAPEVRNLDIILREEPQEQIYKRPLYDLYKFKVVKIIGTGMLVLHSEMQKIFYVKVIHKTMQFLDQHLILPENVPYMVKLQNHYNCENALFLILEYCNGTRLCDYLKGKTDFMVSNDDSEVLGQIQDTSDNESELSYTDLINEYRHSKANEGSCDQLTKSLDQIDLGANQSSSIRSCDKSNPNIVNNSKLSTTAESNEIVGSRCPSPSRRKFSELSSIEEYPIWNEICVPEEKIVKWASQLLIALEKLHTLGVICRDLELKNLLLDENENIVLTYMCNVKDLCDLYSNGINTNLAPEVNSYQEITEAVDWWSFGAILYELLVGMPLSYIHPNGIKSYTHLKIPRFVSPEARSILKQLLAYDPNSRLGTGANGTENIKSHPFFHSVSWNSVQDS